MTSTLPELSRVLVALGNLGAGLGPDTDPATLDRLRAGLDMARRLLDEATRPGRCPVHRGGERDPETGECLLCHLRPGARPAVGAAPVREVLRVAVDHGETEATRRYGARAVARALAASGRGAPTYQAAARAARRSHGPTEDQHA